VFIAFVFASEEARFGASVALFGMLLRRSEYSGDGDLALVEFMAAGGAAYDPEGLRSEFLQLVARARKLQVEPDAM